jgi:hypothetical protein
MSQSGLDALNIWLTYHSQQSYEQEANINISIL